MSLRTVRSARSLPSLKQALHSSSTAPKPSHLLSASRDKVHSHYASLTVNVLKQECRTRGLKLNGRKNDLVDRLVGFEQTKAFSSVAAAPALAKGPRMKLKAETLAFSTSAANAKPDVANIGIPRVPPSGKEAKTVKIPVSPAKADSHTEVVADYSKRSINTDVGNAIGDIHVVDGAPKVSTMNVDLGDGAPEHEEERTGSANANTVPSADKTFLAVLGGTIAAWWGSKYFAKSKSADSKH